MMIFRGIMIAAVALLATPADAKDDKQSSNSFTTSDSTNIDFSDTLIDGKMQAPAGFFLQGRQAQSMSQLVKLRSKFRSELRNSKAAVKALVK